MKIFKLVLVTLSSIMFCIGITSCSTNSDEPIIDENEEGYVTVPLSLSCEVFSENLPLTRGERQKHYVIHIDELSAGGEENIYASGIFTDISGLQIKFRKGKKYRIQAYLIYDYLKSHEGKPGFTVTNALNYENPQKLKYFTVNGVDLFWAMSEFSSNDTECKINLQRGTCGLEVEVKGKNEGIITINAERAVTLEMDLSQSSKKRELFAPLPLLVANDNTLKDETSPETLTIRYKDSKGKSQLIYSKSITFKRGYTKHLTLNINDVTSETIDRSTSFIVEEGAMQDEAPENIDIDL